MNIASLGDLEVVEQQIHRLLRQQRLDTVLLKLREVERIQSLGHRPPIKLEPFMIAGIAMFALRYCPQRFFKRHSPQLSWNELAFIAEHVNQYLLADPISFDEEILKDYHSSNYVFTFLRIAAAQFPYQIDYYGQYARSLILYQELPLELSSHPHRSSFDFAAAFQTLNGVLLTDFIKVGFTAFATARSNNHLGFTRRDFEIARIQGVDLPSDTDVLAVLARLTATSERFIAEYQEYRQSDPRFAMYNLNPLLLYPIIRPFLSYGPPPLDKDAMVAPLPNLILSRLSVGIFYQMFNHYKTGFSQYFGYLFEMYVGVVLKNSVPPSKLFAEEDIRTTYTSNSGKAPDWAIIDGITAILFECKATRFTRAAVTIGDEDAVTDSLKQVKSGLTQLHEFIEACKVQRPGLEQFHMCTEFRPVLITLEPLYLVNSKPFREHIEQILAIEGIGPFPWLILTIDELEKLQPHLAAGIRLGETIEKLGNTMFNSILAELHTNTGLTYKDSFLYSKEQELYQLLGVFDRLAEG